MSLILIFGVFNPITNAHIEIGKMASSLIENSQVIYIPAKTSFMQGWKEMKNNLIMDETTRIRLIEESLKPYHFICETCEIEGYSDGKTYNTIQFIKNKYNTEDITVCMGDDKLIELERWYQADALLSENRFLIIHRNEDNDCLNVLNEKYRKNFTLFKADHKYQNVSSTQIRNAYIENNLESIEDVVPESVYSYLRAHENIYSKED